MADMNDRDALLEQRDDLARLARHLYGALMDARPYVLWQAAAAPTDWRSETAHNILERIDAALADAADYFPRAEERPHA